MSIGSRIVRLRENKSWNQRELAKRVNLNVSVMNRIESGDRPVKDHELSVIANALDTTSDYLLGRTENPNPIDEKDFQSFINDPELERWYKELPKSDEEDLRRLRRIWKAFKEDEK